MKVYRLNDLRDDTETIDPIAAEDDSERRNSLESLESLQRSLF